MGQGFHNVIYEKMGIPKRALSAGIGTSKLIDSYIDLFHGAPGPKIQKVMLEKGIDISEQKIKLLTPDMLPDVRLVVVLCDPDLCPPFLVNAGIQILYRHVRDPYKLTLKEMRIIRDQVFSIVMEASEIENQWNKEEIPLRENRTR